MKRILILCALIVASACLLVGCSQESETPKGGKGSTYYTGKMEGKGKQPGQDSKNTANLAQ
jgi:ABC-type oligopeptide transport system substrate-binding subunit